MKKVFVTRKLLKENEQKLQELFKVKLNSKDKNIWYRGTESE